MKKHSKIQPFILIIIYYVVYYLGVEKFVYKSMFFHYVLILTTCILFFYVSIKSIERKQNIRLNFSFPVIISFCLIVFPFVSLLFTGQIEWHFTSHYIASFTLFIILSICFSSGLINKNGINDFFVYSAVCESVICIFQFFGFSVVEKTFSISGTNNNPNITAMFLVMVLPIVIEGLKKRNKYLSIFILILLITALVLLKSRTAYLGLSVLTITYTIYYFSKLSKILVLTCMILFIIGGMIFIPKLYEFKQDSADGRLFVWKVSTQMMIEKPLGYGYGMTQGAYNNAQAEYFQTHETTKTEQRNAGYMHYIMNDYIEMAIQGGIIGGLFYLAFIVSLIYSGLKQKKKTLFVLSGIMAFAAMSITNFTFYSVFAVMIFTYYAAQIKAPTLISISIKIPISVLSIIACLSAFVYFILQINSQFNLTEINKSVKEKDFEKAKILSEKAFYFVSSSELYYRSFGEIYLSDEDYATAKEYYKQAIKFAPFPEVIMRKAYCEMQLENYAQAEKDLIFASNIKPVLFQPHYNLMMLFLTIKDFQKAKEKAEYILEKEIKIPSKEVEHYKKRAIEILELFNKTKVQPTI